MGRLASVADALREVKAGRVVVVGGGHDRKNGDLTVAAEMVTPEIIHFMQTRGRGAICLAMTGERLDALDLAPMDPDKAALYETAFEVSIELRSGNLPGISGHDWAATIRAALDPSSRPADFARPGHVFPLRARPGGVLERPGHTEAAVDLARLAGLYPAGVICRISNADDTIHRRHDLAGFCKAHGLLMVAVPDIARYRADGDAVLGALDLCSRSSSEHLRLAAARYPAAKE